MINIKIPNDKKEELVAQIQQFFMEEDLDEIGPLHDALPI